MRFFLALVLAATPLAAQHDMSTMGHDMSKMGNMPGMQHDMSKMGQKEMGSMDMSHDEQMSAGGTSYQPESTPMGMIHRKAGPWSFMFHGVFFVTDIQQTGPRGGDKFMGMGWMMTEASRSLGPGTFSIRTMLSPDPATVTNRYYPLLFQTGETAYGKPIIDGQHPHDFVMELAVQYRWHIADKTTMTFYAAPVGEPALGPVAFPHRASASEIPQAVISHHLQDSTHISNEVVTVGITQGKFGIEASGFHGAEPNENRWNIDKGAIDSWSTRLTFRPTRNWSTQFSAGHLNHPEALETTNQNRLIASVSYNRPINGGDWASTFVWGRVHKIGTTTNVTGWLGETMVHFKRDNYISGRVEVAGKDELFAETNPLAGRVFWVGAYTAGYTRDIPLFSRVATGLGINATTYRIPTALENAYGKHPASVVLFLRFKLKES